MKSKGSALQTTLVIWSVIMICIVSLTKTNTYRNQIYSNIDLMMKQKNIEIGLIKYYIETMENDILISDEFSAEEYYIKYNVEDMWDYYVITTYVKFDNVQYTFTCQINTADYVLTSFEYN